MKRKFIQTALLGAVISATLMGGACKQEKYYWGWELGQEGLVGKIEISEDAPQARDAYKFYYENFRLKKVEQYANGVVSDWGSRWAVALIERGEDKSVSVKLMKATGLAATSTGGWHKVVMTPDGEGKALLTFYTENGRPVVNKNYGANKERLHFDEEGRVVVRELLDRKNNPIRSSMGMQRIKYARDKSGFLIEKALFNEKDQAVDSILLGIHKFIYQNNVQGRMVSIKGFDVKAKPVAEKGSGCYEEKNQYDGMNRIRESCLDLKGKLIKRGEKEKLGYATIQSKYDRSGRVLEVAYFGVNGKPSTYKKEKYHKIKTEYGPQGYIKSFAYYDVKGKPTVAAAEDFHRAEFKFDGAYRVLEQSYFDGKHKKTLDKRSGVHKETRVYNARGLIAKESYYDVKGQGTCDKTQPFKGCSIMERAYNQQGKITSLKCFDGKGKPSAEKNGGWHQLKREYSPSGLLAGVTFVDLKGKPMKHKFNNCTKLAYKNNKMNQTLEKTCLDQKGKITRQKGRFHSRLVMEYNQYGDMIKRSFYDDKAKPLEIYDAVHMFRVQYDDRGKESNFAFFNDRQKPTSRRGDKLHKVLNTYTPEGRMLVQHYQDVKGKATVGGHFRSTEKHFEYYKDGRLKKVVFKDAKGKVKHTFKY